ncbi:hypothetical protein D3C78_1342200 [compost metagenome]
MIILRYVALLGLVSGSTSDRIRLAWGAANEYPRTPFLIQSVVDELIQLLVARIRTQGYLPCLLIGPAPEFCCFRGARLC